MQPEALDEVDPPDDPLQPATLAQWLAAGQPVTIVDIRTKADFDEWHIDGPAVDIVNIPAYDFIDDENEAVLERVPDSDPLIIVCAEGKSSALIAGWLTGQGYNARNLANGMEGWSRVYVDREVSGYKGPGTLFQYFRPSSGCLAYMLVQGGEAAVFDPLRAFTDRYLSDSADRDADLVYAFDTHVHADHVSGVRDLTEEGVEGVLPAPAIERGVTYESTVSGIDDGDTLSVGEATVEAVHTPGHTTGMTSYLISDTVLLTGDGLFTESVARPDLEAGDDGAPEAARQLHRTIKDVIFELPSDTLVAGGHTSETAQPAPDRTYTATIAELREDMPLLKADEDDFVDRILSDMPPRPANYQQIIAINIGQDTVGETEAFELELGPNNCATSRGTLS